MKKMKNKSERDGKIIQTFGAALRECRLRANLTQAALSELAGLTPNYIGLLERGLRNPSFTTVCALANALGVKPGVWFGWGELSDGSPNLSGAAHEAGLLFQGAPAGVQAPVILLLKAVQGAD